MGRGPNSLKYIPSLFTNLYINKSNYEIVKFAIENSLVLYVRYAFHFK